MFYFVLRSPKELGAFRWVVDAKDIGETKYERLWRQLVLPLMQSRSVAEPLSTLEGSDYSAFDRFCITKSDLPEHLKSYSKGYGGVNMKLLLEEDFTLGDSKSDPALRLVDVLASAFTRALNGQLRLEGCERLGTLMIARRPRTVKMARLSNEGAAVSVLVPYADIVDVFEATARSVWPSKSA